MEESDARTRLPLRMGVPLGMGFAPDRYKAAPMYGGPLGIRVSRPELPGKIACFSSSERAPSILARQERSHNKTYQSNNEYMLDTKEMLGKLRSFRDLREGKITYHPRVHQWMF